MSGRRRALALLVALLLLVVLPVGGTTASWTAVTASVPVAAGTGDWCAVPNPDVNPRAYRVADMPVVAGRTGTTSRLIIVPVANNAAWGFGTGTRTYGARTWSCSTTTATPRLQVTGWNRVATSLTATSADGTSPLVAAPASRVSPTAGFGAAITGASRGTAVTANPQYSSIVAAGRTLDSPDTRPTGCGLLGSLTTCNPSLQPEVGWSSVFRPTTGAAVDPANRFVATRAAGGLLGGSYSNATLAPYAGNVDATGQGQVEYVVIEVFGTLPAPIPGDLVVEIYLQ